LETRPPNRFMKNFIRFETLVLNGPKFGEAYRK